MNDRGRVLALARELDDTRRAAAKLILDFVQESAPTPEMRERLARAFDAKASGADEITARLARLVALELRQ